MMKSAKITSVILVLCMLLVVFAVGTASAGAADIADTGDGMVINFDNSFISWEGPIMFYVYDPQSDSELMAWGSKKTFGTDNGNGIWSKDLSDLNLEDGKQYCVIFADSATGQETYDLLFDTSCNGDTAYRTGNRMENPIDSNRTADEAAWKNADPNRFGSRKQVASIGNVVGNVIPSYTSGYQMFEDFLKDDIDNARMYSGRDDQTLLDDVAAQFGLTKNDVAKAIAESGVRGIVWFAEKSCLPDGSSFDGVTAPTDKPAATEATEATEATAKKDTSAKSPNTGSSSAGLVMLLVFAAFACTVVSVKAIAKKHN